MGNNQAEIGIGVSVDNLAELTDLNKALLGLMDSVRAMHGMQAAGASAGGAISASAAEATAATAKLGTSVDKLDENVVQLMEAAQQSPKAYAQMLRTIGGGIPDSELGKHGKFLKTLFPGKDQQAQLSKVKKDFGKTVDYISQQLGISEEDVKDLFAMEKLAFDPKLVANWGMELRNQAGELKKLLGNWSRTKEYGNIAVGSTISSKAVAQALSRESKKGATKIFEGTGPVSLVKGTTLAESRVRFGPGFIPPNVLQGQMPWSPMQEGMQAIGDAVRTGFAHIGQVTQSVQTATISVGTATIETAQSAAQTAASSPGVTAAQAAAGPKLNVGEGWKLHLKVGQNEQDRAKVREHLKSLEASGGISSWKEGNADVGKSFTVYVGALDDAQNIAHQLHNKFSHILETVTEADHQMSTDVKFVGNIMGRFDSHQNQVFARYGFSGHQALLSDFQPGGRINSALAAMGGTGKMSPEVFAAARQDAYDELARRYGTIFTGSARQYQPGGIVSPSTQTPSTPSSPATPSTPTAPPPPPPAPPAPPTPPAPPPPPTPPGGGGTVDGYNVYGVKVETPQPLPPPVVIDPKTLSVLKSSTASVQEVSDAIDNYVKNATIPLRQSIAKITGTKNPEIGKLKGALTSENRAPAQILEKLLSDVEKQKAILDEKISKLSQIKTPAAVRLVEQLKIASDDAGKRIEDLRTKIQNVGAEEKAAAEKAAAAERERIAAMEEARMQAVKVTYENKTINELARARIELANKIEASEEQAARWAAVGRTGAQERVDQLKAELKYLDEKLATERAIATAAKEQASQQFAATSAYGVNGGNSAVRNITSSMARSSQLAISAQRALSSENAPGNDYLIKLLNQLEAERKSIESKVISVMSRKQAGGIMGNEASNAVKAWVAILEELEQAIADVGFRMGKVAAEGTDDVDAHIKAYKRLEEELMQVREALEKERMASNNGRAEAMRTLGTRIKYYERELDAIFRAGFRLKMVGMDLKFAGQRVNTMVEGAVRQFGDFEYTLGKAASSLGDWTLDLDNTTGGFLALQESVLNTSVSLKLFDANEVAQAVYYYASTTGQAVNSNQDLVYVMQALAPIMQAAAITGAGYEETIKGVYGVVSQFNPKLVENAVLSKDYNLLTARMADVTEKLFYVTQLTAAEMSDLINSFKMVGPVAAQSGASFEDMVDILGRLADIGIKGTMAGRGMRQMFIQMARPTPQANKALDALFATAEQKSTELANRWQGKTIQDIFFPKGEFAGTSTYIHELALAMMQVSTIQKNYTLSKISTANELPILTALIEQETNAILRGGDATSKTTDLSIKAHERFVASWNKLSKSTNAVIGGVERTFQALQIYVGGAIADAINPTLMQVQEIIDSIRQWAMANRELVSNIGGAVAALGVFMSALGGIAMVAGSFVGLAAAIKLVAAAFLPVALTIGGALAFIGSLAAVIIANFDSLSASISAFASSIMSAFNSVQLNTEQLIAILADVFHPFIAAAGIAIYIVKSLIDTMTMLMNMIPQAGDRLNALTIILTTLSTVMATKLVMDFIKLINVSRLWATEVVKDAYIAQGAIVQYQMTVSKGLFSKMFEAAKAVVAAARVEGAIVGITTAVKALKAMVGPKGIIGIIFAGLMIASMIPGFDQFFERLFWNIDKAKEKLKETASNYGSMATTIEATSKKIAASSTKFSFTGGNYKFDWGNQWGNVSVESADAIAIVGDYYQNLAIGILDAANNKDAAKIIASIKRSDEYQQYILGTANIIAESLNLGVSDLNTRIGELSLVNPPTVSSEQYASVANQLLAGVDWVNSPKSLEWVNKKTSDLMFMYAKNGGTIAYDAVRQALPGVSSEVQSAVFRAIINSDAGLSFSEAAKNNAIDMTDKIYEEAFKSFDIAMSQGQLTNEQISQVVLAPVIGPSGEKLKSLAEYAGTSRSEYVRSLFNTSLSTMGKTGAELLGEATDYVSQATASVDPAISALTSGIAAYNDKALTASVDAISEPYNKLAEEFSKPNPNLSMARKRFFEVYNAVIEGNITELPQSMTDPLVNAAKLLVDSGLVSASAVETLGNQLGIEGLKLGQELADAYQGMAENLISGWDSRKDSLKAIRDALKGPSDAKELSKDLRAAFGRNSLVTRALNQGRSTRARVAGMAQLNTIDNWIAMATNPETTRKQQGLIRRKVESITKSKAFNFKKLSEEQQTKFIALINAVRWKNGKPPKKLQDIIDRWNAANAPDAPSESQKAWEFATSVYGSDSSLEEAGRSKGTILAVGLMNGLMAPWSNPSGQPDKYSINSWLTDSLTGKTKDGGQFDTALIDPITAALARAAADSGVVSASTNLGVTIGNGIVDGIGSIFPWFADYVDSSNGTAPGGRGAAGKTGKKLGPPGPGEPNYIIDHTPFIPMLIPLGSYPTLGPPGPDSPYQQTNIPFIPMMIPLIGDKNPGIGSPSNLDYFLQWQEKNPNPFLTGIQTLLSGPDPIDSIIRNTTLPGILLGALGMLPPALDRQSKSEALFGPGGLDAFLNRQQGDSTHPFLRGFSQYNQMFGTQSPLDILLNIFTGRPTTFMGEPIGGNKNSPLKGVINPITGAPIMPGGKKNPSPAYDAAMQELWRQNFESSMSQWYYNELTGNIPDAYLGLSGKGRFIGGARPGSGMDVPYTAWSWGYYPQYGVNQATIPAATGFKLSKEKLAQLSYLQFLSEYFNVGGARPGAGMGSWTRGEHTGRTRRDSRGRVLKNEGKVLSTRSDSLTISDLVSAAENLWTGPIIGGGIFGFPAEGGRVPSPVNPRLSLAYAASLFWGRYGAARPGAGMNWPINQRGGFSVSTIGQNMTEDYAHLLFGWGGSSNIGGAARPGAGVTLPVGDNKKHFNIPKNIFGFFDKIGGWNGVGGNLNTKLTFSVPDENKAKVLNNISAWSLKLAEGGTTTGEAWGNNLDEGAVRGVNGGLLQIRAMMVGQSPPKAGPLKHIDKGGFNIGKAWGSSFHSAAIDSIHRGAKEVKHTLDAQNRDFAHRGGMNVSLNHNSKKHIQISLNVTGDGSANRTTMTELRRGLMDALAMADLEHMVEVI